MTEPVTAAAAAIAAAHYIRLKPELARKALLLHHTGVGEWSLLRTFATQADGASHFGATAATMTTGVLVLWWQGRLDRAAMTGGEG